MLSRSRSTADMWKPNALRLQNRAGHSGRADAQRWLSGLYESVVHQRFGPLECCSSVAAHGRARREETHAAAALPVPGRARASCVVGRKAVQLNHMQALVWFRSAAL